MIDTAKHVLNLLKEGKDITENQKRIAFPCLFSSLVPVEKIKYNEYNPNNVANPEMKLLKHSIEEDGYTQPIVTIYDEKNDEYIVIDGAHRYKNAIKLKIPFAPVVVLEKKINERMSSTIRHNRARGEHSVDGMSNIVSELYKMGWGDERIGVELGMEKDEVLRLKQITGLAELFADKEFSESWEVENEQ